MVASCAAEEARVGGASQDHQGIEASEWMLGEEEEVWDAAEWVEPLDPAVPSLCSQRKKKTIKKLLSKQREMVDTLTLAP